MCDSTPGLKRGHFIAEGVMGEEETYVLAVLKWDGEFQGSGPPTGPGGH